MNACAHTRTHGYVCFVYPCVCTCVHSLFCLYLFAYARVYVCTYGCMKVCTYLRMYACMCERAHAHACAQGHKYACAYVCVFYVRMHGRTCVRMYGCRQLSTCVCICVYMAAYVYTCACICVCIRGLADWVFADWALVAEPKGQQIKISKK